MAVDRSVCTCTSTRTTPATTMRSSPSEVTRALRFPTKARADDYIRSRVGFDAVAAPFLADELVRNVDQVSKGEVSDLAAR